MTSARRGNNLSFDLRSDVRCRGTSQMPAHIILMVSPTQEA